MKTADALRRTLVTRLNAASGLLLGQGYKDSHLAVTEAISLVSAAPDVRLYQASASPVLGSDIEALREIRKWHYDQYHDKSQRAAEMQKKSDSRMFSSASRNEFERVATGFQAAANRHLKYVRALNALFPDTDKIK